MDLLQADDAEFARWCRTIAVPEGGSVLDQLAGQLDKLGRHVADADDPSVEMEIVSRQMQILVDGLELTRGRLRTAMGRLSVPM